MTIPMCDSCGETFYGASACKGNPLLALRSGGISRIYRRRPFAGGRCRTCGVTAGNRHHAGCDREPCPGCDGVLSCCDCEVAPHDVRVLALVEGEPVPVYGTGFSESDAFAVAGWNLRELFAPAG